MTPGRSRPQLSLGRIDQSSAEVRTELHECVRTYADTSKDTDVLTRGDYRRSLEQLAAAVVTGIMDADGRWTADEIEAV